MSSSSITQPNNTLNPVQTLEGSCLCSAVQYRISAQPLDAGYCHCRLCQRSSGAPTLAWLTVPVGGFCYTKGRPAIFQSSPHSQREFCSACGTQLAFHRTASPATVDVTLASLHNPALIAPQYHIWRQSRIAWFETTDSLPRYDDAGPDTHAADTTLSVAVLQNGLAIMHAHEPKNTTYKEQHMSTPNPVDTVTQLVKAVNQGNLEAAVACYETDATLIVQPGQVATGKKAIREAFAGFIAMKLTITTETHKIIQAGDIVLFISKWTATGTAPDGAPMKMGGMSSDVLRRQTDGQWLIAIDNPFGAAILD